MYILTLWLGKPQFMVQLRHCLQGRSSARSQGTLSTLCLLGTCYQGTPLAKMGTRKVVWPGCYCNRYGWDSVCQATRDQPRTLSQIPLISPQPLVFHLLIKITILNSILKARGRCAFSLKMHHHQPNCHPRLQWPVMWHAYRTVQLETNLAIIMSCKQFS